MGAIAGIAGRPDPGLVRRMCGALAHRGPDAEGFHDDAHASLGVRRLAVADAAEGAQPVYSENGRIVAVFDGRLYNHAELRALLAARGHRLKGSGDTECLVHLYEEYGDAMVHHLRGMFAFAIWDSREERLLLARDRVGEKPLFWRSRDGVLEFASELKALEGPVEIDPVALHHYLTLQYVPAPWSIRRGVAKLLPGHLLTFSNGSARTAPYWRLDSAEQPLVDEPEEALRTHLLEATKIRTMGEGPVGVFLTGGLGPAAVVAATARETGHVRTFGVSSAQAGPDGRARRLAEFFGADHEEFVVDSAEIDALDELSGLFDEPFAGRSALAASLLARHASAGVTVALTGYGGEAAFGARYARFGDADRPAGLARRALSRAGVVLRSRPSDDPGPAQRYARSVSSFSPEEKEALYTPAFAATLAGVETYDLFDEAYDRSPARASTRFLDVDLQTYLPGDLLARVDTTTMAHSLEARSPLLDTDLLGWAAALPAELKSGTLLQDALCPWLPSDILRDPGRSFTPPLAAWLRTGLRDVARDLLTDGTATSRGLFRPEEITRLLDAHDAGADHAHHLWPLLHLEAWARSTPVPA